MDEGRRGMTLVPLKRFCSEVDVRAGGDQPPLLSVSIHRGVVPRSQFTDDQPRADDLSNYKLCEPSDVVLNRMRAFQGAIGVSHMRGIVSPDYLVLRPSSGVLSAYLHYAFRSQWFVGEMTSRIRGIGSTELGTVRTPRINASDLLGIELALPDLPQQRRIADFLDDQIARIDNIITARRRQIELLDEMDVSRMADVLVGTPSSDGGLQTGLAWMPLLPSGWGFGPVWTCYNVQLGKMLNPERAAGPHQRRYLRNANVHWFDISISDTAQMSFEPSERNRYRVLPGDLLVCEGGAGVAEAAIWRGEIDECYYQKSLHRVRPTRHLSAEWLMYWLRVAKESGVFRSEGNLATIPHLTGEQLREYRIPIPPAGTDLLGELRLELSRTARLRFVHSRGINLLGELKRALITSAVTGEFDVSSADGSRVPA